MPDIITIKHNRWFVGSELKIFDTYKYVRSLSARLFRYTYYVYLYVVDDLIFTDRFFTQIITPNTSFREKAFFSEKNAESQRTVESEWIFVKRVPPPIQKKYVCTGCKAMGVFAFRYGRVRVRAFVRIRAVAP